MLLHYGKSLLLAISIIILVELFLFPRTAFSLNCNALPLVVPVTNTTLSTGFQRRGLPISIGTPAQEFSLMAFILNNNTVFGEGPTTNDNNCNKTESSGNKCIMIEGGVFDRDNSSSWAGPMSKEEFRGASDVFQSVDVMGEETMSLSGLELKNVPIYIMNEQPSAMGLGTNSSLLNSLVASGDIPSRVWGLDWGWTGATNDTWKDGSLVLGGYDKSRVKDNNLFPQDFSLDPDGCFLMVTITEISMKNDTSEVELLNGKPIAACVTPAYELITLPLNAFTIFNNAMGDIYLNRSYSDFYLWGFLSDVENGYKGSMTITLSNGFSTTIPNHELIQPFRDYDSDGKPVIGNSQWNVLMLNSLQGDNINDLPLLGIPFLSAAYLVVDSDQGKFQLGETIASNSQALIPGAHAQCTQTSSTSTATSHALSASSSSHLGVVVGTAVAVSVVVLVVAVIAVFRYNRWKESNPRDEQVTDPEGPESTYELPSHPQRVPSIHEADSSTIQHNADCRM